MMIKNFPLPLFQAAIQQSKSKSCKNTKQEDYGDERRDWNPKLYRLKIINPEFSDRAS
jgi:hypothetical protein